jgi:hypothetical protein
LAFEPTWPHDTRSIEKAATRSVGGIFPFIKEDDLADPGQAKLVVPRDKVIFEAGTSSG